MTPVEMMAKAFAGDTYWRYATQFRREEIVRDMRDALRALAEMLPTELMLARAVMEGTSDIDGHLSITHEQTLERSIRAYIRAAAEEGEAPSQGMLR